VPTAVAKMDERVISAAFQMTSDAAGVEVNWTASGEWCSITSS
jgi:hypothetical protein